MSSRGADGKVSAVTCKAFALEIGAVTVASVRVLGAAGVLDTETSVEAAASFWSSAKDWVTFVCTTGGSEVGGA
ncbi:MAG: hypothetical protein MK180_18390 [Rhodobacteraceae bacterium]|nr:hypothetical protein [Paracoccaceae bacterium]